MGFSMMQQPSLFGPAPSLLKGECLLAGIEGSIPGTPLLLEGMPSLAFLPLSASWEWPSPRRRMERGPRQQPANDNGEILGWRISFSIDSAP